MSHAPSTNAHILYVPGLANPPVITKSFMPIDHGTRELIDVSPKNGRLFEQLGSISPL